MARRLLPLLSLGALLAAAPSPARAQPGGAQPAGEVRWRVRTAEHVDLWLHGLALLVDDTARVPLFRQGYRAAVQAERARGSAYTELDANRDRLRQRLAANPGLALGAQFVPLAFPSFEQLRVAVNAFVEAGGDPRRARDQEGAAATAFLAGAFPAAADRDWLRLYTTALGDERDRFYHRYWTGLQQARAGALAAADSAWQRGVRPRVQRFLSGSQQPDGTLLLSPVLGGEGRTQGGARSEAVVAVAYPARAGDALEASYAAAHEFVGALVGQVVADNSSPADVREGRADRLVGAGQVRAGLLLLRRATPELADGYARFYLREAGLPVPNGAGSNGAGPNGGAQAALEAAFPLPPAVLDALSRQLDVVLGGI